MPLSPHEQQLLARIEKDLNKQDPRLARTLTSTAQRSAGSRWFPLDRQHTATLIAALLALILVHALVGEIHPAVSAAVTGGVVITWLVGVTRGGARPAVVERPDDAGGTTPAGPPRAASKRLRRRHEEE